MFIMIYGRRYENKTEDIDVAYGLTKQELHDNIKKWSAHGGKFWTYRLLAIHTLKTADPVVDCVAYDYVARVKLMLGQA